MTTWYIQESGGDFTSLDAAFDSGSTAGADVFEIAGSWTANDTTAVSWSKAVTVNVTGSSKNTNGYPGRENGSYRLVNASGHMFTVTADVVINDMDMMSASTGESDEIFRVNSGGHDVTCRRCLIGFEANIAEQDLVYNDSGPNTITFESCIFYNVGRSIIDAWTPPAASTYNFNGCSSWNIGANGARSDGCWVGTHNGYGDTINAFNNLITGEDTYVFGDDGAGDTVVNADYNLVNWNSGDLSNNGITENLTGNTFEVPFVEGNPAAGQVGFIETGTSPYDLRLYDDADNLAIDYHSVETGPDSGLTIANDILGTVRGASEDHDVGAFEIAEIPVTGISIPIVMNLYRQFRR